MDNDIVNSVCNEESEIDPHKLNWKSESIALNDLITRLHNSVNSRVL